MSAISTRDQTRPLGFRAVRKPCQGARRMAGLPIPLIAATPRNGACRSADTLCFFYAEAAKRGTVFTCRSVLLSLSL